MKRSREDECFLGELTIPEQFDEYYELKKKKQDMYFVFTDELMWCIVRSINGGSRGCTYDVSTRDRLSEIRREIEDQGSKPITRVESVKYRPIFKKNRRESVFAWLICAKRIGLLKDVARLIAGILMKSELSCWNY